MIDFTKPDEMKKWLQICSLEEFPKGNDCLALVLLPQSKVEYYAHDADWLKWVEVYFLSLTKAYRFCAFNVNPSVEDRNLEQYLEKKFYMATHLAYKHPLTPALLVMIDPQTCVNEFMDYVNPLTVSKVNQLRSAHNSLPINGSIPSTVLQKILQIRHIRTYLKCLKAIQPHIEDRELIQQLAPWLQWLDQFPKAEPFC